MNKKELIIKIMKFDQAREDKETKISKVLGTHFQLFEYGEYDIETIPKIIFDFLGYPKEKEKVTLKKGGEKLTVKYCRDPLYRVYISIYSNGDNSLAVEEVADMLIKGSEQNYLENETISSLNRYAR